MECSLLERKISACQNNEYNEICIWGCGFISKGRGWNALQMLDICPTCFCDNNQLTWGATIKNGVVCRPPKELFAKNEVIFFVLVEGEKGEDIVKQISENSSSDVITWEDLCYSDVLVEAFYRKKTISNSYVFDNRVIGAKTNYIFPVLNNSNGKRIAVYTCISGDYDMEAEHVYDYELCDYYIISDKPPREGYGMKWIDLNDIIHGESLDLIRRARLCKILGYSMFSEYEYSLYIDGNMSIKKELYTFLKHVCYSGAMMSIHSHPWYDCAFTEGMVCSEQDKDSESVILTQMNRYKKRGFPRHYGLFATGLLIRKSKSKIKLIMDEWWGEVSQFSRRDQLSLPYSLWKNGVLKEELIIISSDIFKSDLIEVNKHKKKRDK